MDLSNSLMISAYGMRAQSERLRVIGENIANADSTGRTPGELPYRRKTVTFKSEMDKAMGVPLVRTEVGLDNSDFIKKYDPSHPTADAEGYVLRPNVSTIVETMDMREARRSYEANLNMIEVERAMINRTIDMLR